MSGGVNAACSPCQQPAQSAISRVQDDQSKALDVMKDMASGKVSGQDGMKQLQSLVVDQAVAVGALPASAAQGAGGKAPSATGFSARDTFEMGGAKPVMDLSGGGMAKDLTFLDKDSGGGSKPGVASGTN